MSEHPLWPPAWTRAALGTAVLACLEHEDLHGYGIATRLAARGLGRPKGGSLYPLLSALEQDGALQATWSAGDAGPGRRTYRLTDHGRARLHDERRDWARLTAALDAAPAGAHPDPHGKNDR